MLSHHIDRPGQVVEATFRDDLIKTQGPGGEGSRIGERLWASDLLESILEVPQCRLSN